MVREKENLVFLLLVAVLVAGMALTLFFGTAQSNHSYVSRGASSSRR